MPAHDANGNMTLMPTGAALDGAPVKLIWDAWNRLVQINDAATDTLIQRNTYDAKHRRVTASPLPLGEGRGEGDGEAVLHTYYDDNWRPLTQGTYQGSSFNLHTSYLWHPSDRWDLILRDRSTNNDGVLDERRYCLKDQLDPVALTDENGTVTQRFRYTAFGRTTFLNPAYEPAANTSDWEFLFHGEFQDANTVLYNYGFRFYSPDLGRWLNRDPIGEASVSTYSFVSNHSANNIDLIGLVDVEEFDPKCVGPITGGCPTDR